MLLLFQTKRPIQMWMSISESLYRVWLYLFHRYFYNYCTNENYKTRTIGYAFWKIDINVWKWASGQTQKEAAVGIQT